MKKYLILVGAVVFFMLLSMNVYAVSDSESDVWHQKWTQTGYSWEAYSGSKPNIDITDISYTIDGSNATLTMTTAGDMTTDDENVVYTMHLESTESTYYWVYYSNGQGTVVGMGELAGYMTQLDNPISGNKFTASFEISDTSIDYTAIGFNTEHSDVNDQSAESWWDYAPNSEAPYYSADDGDKKGDENTGDGNSGTPGFEVIAILAAMAIVTIFYYRRKK